jgi:hypothetical protein
MSLAASVPISAETSSSCADDVVVVVLAKDTGKVLQRVATSALSKHKILERTARGQGAATRRRSSADGVVGLHHVADEVHTCTLEELTHPDCGCAPADGATTSRSRCLVSHLVMRFWRAVHPLPARAL